MNHSLLPLGKLLAVGCVAGSMIGCAGQGYRPDTAMNDSQAIAFQSCKTRLAQLADQSDNAAKHYQTANQALACLEQAPLNLLADRAVDLMQVHALAIAHLLKAGELGEARTQLDVFKQTHPDGDLALPDGTAFVPTAELLLGVAPREKAAKNSLLNATAESKSEIRRQQYWQMN